MTKKEIAILSFKVMSIYAFIHAADKLPEIFNYMSHTIAHEQVSLINLVPIAVPPLLITICGILLWYGAPLLASSIFKTMVSEEKPQLSSEDVKEIVVSVFGLFVLASSMPDFSQMAKFHSFIIRTGDSESSTLRNTYLIISLSH